MTVRVTFANALSCPSDTLEEADPMKCATLVRTLGTAERKAIASASGLRYASFQPFATAVGTLAARRCLSLSRRNGELGVICTGGPQHCAIARQFLDDAFDFGPTLVNPVSFPFTINGTIASSIAAAVDARGCAVSVGHDHGGFFQALELAFGLVELDNLDQVLIVATADSMALPSSRLASAGLAAPAGDVSIAALVQKRDEGDSSTLRLLGVTSADLRGLHDLDDNIEVFTARVNETGHTLTDFPSQLTGVNVFGATGAVLCMEIASETLRRRIAEETGAFAVKCVIGRRIWTALWKWDRDL